MVMSASAVVAVSTLWTVLGLLSIPTLVLLNGVFVAAEFALVAIRKTRVEEMVSLGIPGAKAVETAINELDRSIAATQLGITLASIGLGWAGEPALAHAVSPLFTGLPEIWGAVAKHSLASALAFCFITFMHVVFGELIPKTLALQACDETAIWIASPLMWFVRLTRPLIVVMNGTGNLIIRMMGFELASSSESSHSMEELSLLIEDTEEAGILDSEQAGLVQNVFRLSSKLVKDCMVPREKMAGLELTMAPDKIMEEVRSGAHTRMPVFEGEVNKIVGIVNTKDLFYLFSLQGIVVLEDALYPALFLKPDATVATALKLFRSAHRPMAIVRDESGIVHGLITLEDILEEIVGDIEDEHDRPSPKLRRKKTTLKTLPALATIVKPKDSGLVRKPPQK